MVRSGLTWPKILTTFLFSVSSSISDDHNELGFQNSERPQSEPKKIGLQGTIPSFGGAQRAMSFLSNGSRSSKRLPLASSTGFLWRQAQGFQLRGAQRKTRSFFFFLPMQLARFLQCEMKRICLHVARQNSLGEDFDVFPLPAHILFCAWSLSPRIV